MNGIKENLCRLLFSGSIKSHEDPAKTIDKIRLAMTECGFELENVGHILIVRVSDLEDFASTITGAMLGSGIEAGANTCK
jgi:hypothetical protein